MAVVVLDRHQMDSQVDAAEEDTALLSHQRVSATLEGLVLLAQVHGLTAAAAVLAVLVAMVLALLVALEALAGPLRLLGHLSLTLVVVAVALALVLAARLRLEAVLEGLTPTEQLEQ